jgi:hypothetical protein
MSGNDPSVCAGNKMGDFQRVKVVFEDLFNTARNIISSCRVLCWRRMLGVCKLV